MKKKPIHTEFVVVLLIIFSLILMVIIANGIKQNQMVTNTQPAQTQSQYKPPPLIPQLVQVVKAAENTDEYDGTHFSVLYPADTWRSAVGINCGEDSEESVVLYFLNVPQIFQTFTTDTITICAEKATTSLSQQKITLQHQLQKGLIDTLSDVTVAGENGLEYDYTRKDFPGHYEKTSVVQKNNYTYHISWSIQTNDAGINAMLKDKTLPDYLKIVLSLILR